MEHTTDQEFNCHALLYCIITSKHLSILRGHHYPPSNAASNFSTSHIMGSAFHHEQSDCKGRERLLVAATPQSNNRTRKRVHVPMRLILAWSFVALVTPAAALDEPHPLSTATAGHNHASRLPIGFFITLLLFIGQAVAAFSSTLVGPAMGITSVFWLMMRNDSAISPKASWM